MAGKTDFIVNGSFEQLAGGDAAAWIALNFQLEPAANGGSYRFRPGAPDGWQVTRGFFALETQAPPKTPSSWDGKVWGFTHDGSIAQDVTGLSRGASYDLAFIAYDSADEPGPSGLEVWWNGQKVAGYGELDGDAGAMSHLTVTAGDGANRLEFRTTGVVVLDDIRLFATGPGPRLDFSLTSQPLGVNLGDTVFHGGEF